MAKHMPFQGTGFGEEFGADITLVRIVYTHMPFEVMRIGEANEANITLMGKRSSINLHISDQIHRNIVFIQATLGCRTFISDIIVKLKSS